MSLPRQCPRGARFFIYSGTLRGYTRRMRIIVGHSNMDLDCLGSLALARVLFPGYRAVRSRLIHPVARTLYNLYADYLDMASMADLDGEQVDAMVVVDTRSPAGSRSTLTACSPFLPLKCGIITRMTRRTSTGRACGKPRWVPTRRSSRRKP